MRLQLINQSTQNNSRTNFGTNWYITSKNNGELVYQLGEALNHKLGITSATCDLPYQIIGRYGDTGMEFFVTDSRPLAKIFRKLRSRLQSGCALEDRFKANQEKGQLLERYSKYKKTRKLEPASVEDLPDWLRNLMK